MGVWMGLEIATMQLKTADKDFSCIVKKKNWAMWWGWC